MANLKERVLNAFTSLNRGQNDARLEKVILRLNQPDIQFPDEQSNDFGKLSQQELEKLIGLVLVTLNAYPETTIDRPDQSEPLKQLLLESLYHYHTPGSRPRSNP